MANIEEISVNNGSTELELIIGGSAFWQSGNGKNTNGVIKRWDELSPDVQSRLEGIKFDIEALVERAKGLISR